MLSIFVERPSSPRHSSSNSPRWPRQKYPPLSELGNCIYDFDLTLWSYRKPLLEVRNLPRNENLSQWSRNLGLALKIVCNSRRGDTLRKHNRTSLNSPTNQELSGLPVLVLCEFDDGGVIHRSRKVVDVVSERAVSRYQNILQRVNSWIEMFEMLHNSTCSFDHSSNSGCCKYAWASIWFTAGGILALLNIRKISIRDEEQAHVVRRDSIFSRVKLLTPILRTFPFFTSSSIAFHVSAIGTLITEICSVTGSTGNLSEDLGNATGQWIRNRSR